MNAAFGIIGFIVTSLAFLAGRTFQKRIQHAEDVKIALRALHEKERRLREAREALERLEDRAQLDSHLEKSLSSLTQLTAQQMRFQTILMAVEQRVAFSPVEHAESLLVLFAKHLRHILHESSMPFLSVREIADHSRTFVDLMSHLTASRFDCLVDEGPDFEKVASRLAESHTVMPWIENWVWPFFELAERVHNELPPMVLSIEEGEKGLIWSCQMDASMPSAASTRLEMKLLGSGPQAKVA